MPGSTPFTLKNNGWLSVPWAEFVGKGGDHGTTASLGWDQSSSQATLTILINFTDWTVAISEILGETSWNAQDSLIQRTIPVKHPIFPYMYAKRIISAHPLAFVQKSPGGGVGQFGATINASQYKYWVLTIGFEVPPYRTVDDATLAGQYGGKEYCRYCTFTPKPSSFAVTREGSSAFKWADDGGGGGLRPTKGDPFPSPLIQILNQDALEIRWYSLPRDAVISETGKINANIAACRNCLNSTPFLGTSSAGYYGQAQSGTVRFDSYEVITTPSPLPPDQLNLPITGFNSVVDLILRFTIFDPPYGNSTYRGHNLSPNNKDNLWYLVTADGTTGTPGIYGMADMNTLFNLTLTPAA